MGNCGTPAAEFGLFRELDKADKVNESGAKEGKLPVYESEMQIPKPAVIKDGKARMFGGLEGIKE